MCVNMRLFLLYVRERHKANSTLLKLSDFKKHFCLGRPDVSKESALLQINSTSVAGQSNQHSHKHTYTHSHTIAHTTKTVYKICQSIFYVIITLIKESQLLTIHFVM